MYTYIYIYIYMYNKNAGIVVKVVSSIGQFSVKVTRRFRQVGVIRRSYLDKA